MKLVKHLVGVQEAPTLRALIELSGLMDSFKAIYIRPLASFPI